MTDADPVERWARAVLLRLAELDQSQKWLGAEVARIEGRDEPYGQGTVGGWLKVGPPRPAQGFAIEKALKEKPGALTRLLGYLPLDAKPALTIEAALEADGSIPPGDRSILLAAIRDIRKRLR